MNNERQIAREIRDEYVETMSKIYYSYFKSYTSRLMKLQVRAQLNEPIDVLCVTVCCCDLLGVM